MSGPDITLSPEVVRIVQDALQLSEALPAQPTPEQVGTARGRAQYAGIRLSLWLRDCQPAQREAA